MDTFQNLHNLDVHEKSRRRVRDISVKREDLETATHIKSFEHTLDAHQESTYEELGLQSLVTASARVGFGEVISATSMGSSRFWSLNKEPFYLNAHNTDRQEAAIQHGAWENYLN